jgi:uncharacterized membrane protein
MGGRWMFGPGYGVGLLGGLFWVIVFAALIGLIAWAVSRLWVHEHPPAGPYAPPMPGPPMAWGRPRDDALDAARVRYARGEIDREQYFRVVEDLTGVPRPTGAAAPPGERAPGYPTAGPAAGAAWPPPPVPEPGTPAAPTGEPPPGA